MATKPINSIKLKNMKPKIDLKEIADIVEISDGYHTFTELYNHRITLFIALCKMKFLYYAQVIEMTIDDGEYDDVWRSKVNWDGSVWEGWFLLGINQQKGEQITYHLPMSRWNETNFAKTLDKAPEFDGHTSTEVLKRLGDIYRID